MSLNNGGARHVAADSCIAKIVQGGETYLPHLCRTPDRG